jgi:hypothetical protein
MNAEIYSEWLRRQGQTVVRTASSYWHSEGMGVFQAFPYHALIEPGELELDELTLRHHAVALRYSLPATSAQGTAGYHAVYTGADYDFDVLSSWARKNVRRGLRQCAVAPISFERYVEEGWELRLDTLARQGRRLKESRADWKRRYSSAADLAGFEIWAAQVQNRLAATLVTFQMQDWYYMIYQQCHRNYLQEHVNNALSFVVTQELIRRPNVHGVFYGMQSLDAPPSVDEFKFRMGYEARAVQQRVVFHPYVRPLVSRVSHWILKAGKELSPNGRRLSKAEGMFRLTLAERNHSG